MGVEARTLAWVLVDQTGRYFWAAPGFRRLPDEIDLAALVTWGSRADAVDAARAAHREYGVRARPMPLRLP